ncbi:MAG: hypothetical protein A3J51_02675 [Omnitrophica WOR_2 bacterium RIFCSPHIGHO2_02_FULL_45_21]|nr:MAG: hypothetical protein A3J51_02675 [Omnitrophica WOR_2 bacterium RIFCSPHIGHO2_02_FULL_45_21]
MKNQKSKLSILLIMFWLYTPYPLPCVRLYAEEAALKKAKQLEELILLNPKDAKAIQSLDELSEIYFAERQYAPLIEFLRKLEKINPPGPCDVPAGYYIALCRYHQLKYLEESKNWQEYFDLGNVYRQELFLETEKLAEACPAAPSGVRAQALNWLQHKAQNDAQAASSLAKLTELVDNYLKTNPQDIEVIKEVADSLSKEEEPALARSTYNIYINQLLSIEKSPLKLQSIAESALKEGKVSLAELIYDRYIELVKDSLAKDNLANELTAVIKQFAASGQDKGNDPLYAEKLFVILKEACGKSYFNQELQYLRAYNLERLKEYARSAEEYAGLVTDFPKNIYLDQAEFKLGVIYTYILGQKELGLGYWQKVIERNSALEYVTEGLYHKSLINQYLEDFETAGAGYAKITELIVQIGALKNLSERVLERQKEIRESRPIEYNLKTFLDATLSRPLDTKAGLELLVSPFKVISLKEEEIKFSLQQLRIEMGCFAPELSYLWSGDLGSIQPQPTAPEFTTTYKAPGVKVVNLVVLGSSGVIGSSLEMVEVY